MLPPVILAAAGAVASAPHLHATRVDHPPVLDGRLDDDAWKKAEATDSFTQSVPRDGAPPTNRTVLRMVYDDDAVYAAFDCWQSTPVIERLTRRDRIVESDYVELDLGSRFDHTSTFSFAVYASGQLID